MKLRRFKLYRGEDVTGVSGIGIVAYGVLLPSEQCVMEWSRGINSIVIWKNVEEMMEVVTHKGKNDTRLVWIDDGVVS